MKYHVFILPFLLGFSNLALSETENFLSAKVIQSKSDASGDFVKKTVINPLYTHDCKDSANGWMLSGGWIFENNVIEVGYIDLGTITSKAYFYGFDGEQTSSPQITNYFDTSASGLNISYKRLLNISENIDIFGHVGGFLYQSEAKTYRTSTSNYSRDQEKFSGNGVSLSYGVGIKFYWVEVSLLMLDKIKIDDFGDSDVTSISVGFTKNF